VKTNESPWQEYFKLRFEALVEEAAEYGFVATVEQCPLLPLKMGNYETVVTIREMRS
jgi:hypothetical protein